LKINNLPSTQRLLESIIRLKNGTDEQTAVGLIRWYSDWVKVEPKPVDNWNDSHVYTWFKSVGVNYRDGFICIVFDFGNRRDATMDAFKGDMSSASESGRLMQWSIQGDMFLSKGVYFDQPGYTHDDLEYKDGIFWSPDYPQVVAKLKVSYGDRPKPGGQPIGAKLWQLQNVWFRVGERVTD